MKTRNNIRSGAAALTIAACVWASTLAMAAEKPANDPTGTWKLSIINPKTKDRTPERTLKLTLEDGKLIGTIDGQSSVNGKVKIYEWPIKDAKVQGNQISFSVTHPPVVGNGPESTTSYQAQITGDTIKGTAETEWNGNTFKRTFEAKRVSE
jgi:hypothetical protein